MTIADVAAEVLALAGKATPEPWHTGTMAWPGSGGQKSCDAVFRSEEIGTDLIAPCNYDGGDAAFIAHARTSAPLLAAWVAKVAPLIEALRVERGCLAEALDTTHGPFPLRLSKAVDDAVDALLAAVPT